MIGPEAPLVDGLADRLRSRGHLVVGPGADGARLEGSKAFMKEVLDGAGVPTARWGSFADERDALRFLRSLPGPYVVKTDGLAGGKGVLVTGDLREAEEDIRAKLSGAVFGGAGRRVVVEECMEGPEVSLLVLCDGTKALPLAPAQDFKRVGDGDTGPNTGGMGAYSPVPVAGEETVGEVMECIVEPTLAYLNKIGIEYRGVLYAGLMLTAEGAKVVEYNVRFGDPEAEVVLPRVDGDLAELLFQTAQGSLPSAPPRAAPEYAVCVVLASPGYPLAPRTGDRIEGVEEAQSVEGVTVFHAGTHLDDEGRLRNSGGRVLTITAEGNTLAEARRRAYEAAGKIELPGKVMRTDIAEEAARL